MWCLTTINVQKERCVGYYYRNDTESHTVQQQKPLILQHDLDTDISLTYLSSFSINQQTVLLYWLITYKSYGFFSIETYSLISPNMFVTLQGETTWRSYIYIWQYIPCIINKIQENFRVSFDFDSQLDSWKYL